MKGFVYTREIIKAILFNWPDIEQVEDDFRLIDMRCDIEMALAQIEHSAIKRKDVATILAEGEAIVKSKNPDGIEDQVVEDLVSELFTILNVEGLW